MAQKHVYNPSPIDMALLEVQVAQREDFVPLELNQCVARSKNRYPSVFEARALEAQIGGVGGTSGGRGVAASAHETFHGFSLISKDGFDTCRFLTSSFTFQHSAPYDSWETFRKKARKQWDIYREVTRFKAITRVGLRYVNKFAWNGEPVENVLNIFPAVPNEVGSAMSGLLRLEVPQDTPGMFLIVTQAIPSREAAKLILDIDLTLRERIPQDNVELWRVLNNVNARAYTIFEACLTAETRRALG